MSYQAPLRTLSFSRSLRPAGIVLAFALGIATFLAQSATAQTYSVIHNFTGGLDGANPGAGLAIDASGNLYGTTALGGASNLGTVFKLRPSGSGGTLAPLYSFLGGKDAAYPEAPPTIGPNGILYGTTAYGTGGCGGIGCGAVFSLRPSPNRPATVFAPWMETVINGFPGGSSGANPLGNVIFDQAGNLYGTTHAGGSGYGTVFELTPSNGGWTETVLYAFAGGNDGDGPEGGVIFDSAGNLYGTTNRGGSTGRGIVYQLTPSGSGWTENILYNFLGGTDGANPAGGLASDPSGNLYGTTTVAGLCCDKDGGTVFEVTYSNGQWTLSTAYPFQGPGLGPFAELTVDAAGNLYGTTNSDGAYSLGSVFKLTPSGGGWSYTALHDFSGGNDGAYPYSNIVFDANGNLYGTTYRGGTNGLGLVFTITP